MSASDIILKLSNVESYYGPIQAIRGISLEVPRGKIVTVLGANGAGKTTVLKTISGILDPQKGSIEFLGQPIQRMEADKIVRLGLSHVPEGREVFPFLSVRENLMMGAYPRRDRDAVAGDQILLGGEVLEHAPALEHLDQAEPRDVVRPHAVDATVAELHGALCDLAALGAQHAGDGLQRRRLAGAVGAQQRRDLPIADVDRHALQDEDDAVVDDFDVVDRQHGEVGRRSLAARPLFRRQDFEASAARCFWITGR